MARKVGQIIARGDGRWLIRVFLGRDHETKKRNYHNRTIHGPMREARAYSTRKLRYRDLGRDLEGAKITLNEYLDRWIQSRETKSVREDLPGLRSIGHRDLPRRRRNLFGPYTTSSKS
ncbi:MAG: hypothetical protein WCF22_16700 [Candidatus Sulfotelmatobacter sp.]